MTVETISPDPAKLYASLDVGFDHLKGEVEFRFEYPLSLWDPGLLAAFGIGRPAFRQEEPFIRSLVLKEMMIFFDLIHAAMKKKLCGDTGGLPLVPNLRYLNQTLNPPR